MKAYLINPFNKTITETFITDGKTDINAHMKDIYAALKCSVFEISAYLSETVGDCIFVDEEGLLKELDEQKFFTVEIYDGEAVVPLAGMGLVLGGTNDDGDTLEPVWTIEQVRAAVKWATLDDLREMDF